jgi:excinuclease ABC subunit A
VSKPSSEEPIRLRGCRQHNLRNLDLDIPRGKLTVVTGPSGSGKSSLAFHTLYAEGQRRYAETFSPYVRQFFDRMDKPEVDSIEGIAPALAIEQKNNIRSTRSTVGTLTEINDHLKLLFARLAAGFDPHTGEEIRPDSPQSATAWTQEHFRGCKVQVSFPVPVPAKMKAAELFPLLAAQGFLRISIQGSTLRTDETPPASIHPLPATLDVVQDRLTVQPANHQRLAEALEAAFLLGKGAASVSNDSARRDFSTSRSNPATGFTLPEASPALFSFHSPLGACPDCRGFGRRIGLDLSKAVPDPSLSILQGAIKPFQGERGAECQRDLLRCCRERDIPVKTPWQDLPPHDRNWILNGDPLPGSWSRQSEMEQLEALWRSGGWYGVKGFFGWLETKTHKMHVRVFLSRYRSYTTCPTCRGGRLNPEALCFRIKGKTLPDLWAMPVAELLPWFENLEHSAASPKDRTLDLLLAEIRSRLSYLREVGLSYLTLDRTARSLSGGETERVNLTACLGTTLTGTLIVLDEPTAGLHARDVARLCSVLHKLRDNGNTLVVVEHDPSVMRAADNLIDLGPGAGEHGGSLIHHGPIPKRTPKSHPSSTLAWLAGTRVLPATSRRKPGKAKLSIRGATIHNLRGLDADIPLERFVCITGVSGSGKSTLVHEVVFRNVAHLLGCEGGEEPAPVRSITGHQSLAGVQRIDQSAVARTPRSTPALLLGAFDPIRELFRLTPEAKAANLTAGFFSFNAGEGRCDRCAGAGFEKVDMQFLPDLQVSCADCEGRRYKQSTLSYRWNGKSIADVLELTATEALAFLRTPPDADAKTSRLLQTARDALKPLVETGLGYLKLGQPLNTLSGGESQRVKLCQLLAHTEETHQAQLLILDEPTTGLHFGDVERLLAVLRGLVDAGHSLLVVEHNPDLIRAADWVIDLGPDAGTQGGNITAQGTPEDLAACDSPTGRCLREHTGTATNHSRPAKPQARASCEAIELSGARHHNLKNISLSIPRNRFVVVSGLSGSGKSTLAFDILFAEGQRRFLDAMSTYARQFAEQLEKPDIDSLRGLPPPVAIEQRVSQGGNKSTVATTTEVGNFTRLLFAKLGVIHCPDCKTPVRQQSAAAIGNEMRRLLQKGPLRLLAPVVRGRKGYHNDVAAWASRQGFEFLVVDGKRIRTAEFPKLERFKEHDIDVETAEWKRMPGKGAAPLHAVLEQALEAGKGTVKLVAGRTAPLLLSLHASCPSCQRSFDQPEPRLFSFNSPRGWCPECRGHGRVPRGRMRIRPDTSRFDSLLEAELHADLAADRIDDAELSTCPECLGSRLNPVAAATRLSFEYQPAGRKTTTTHSVSASELATLTVEQAHALFTTLRFPESRAALIARDILPEIRQRLAFLCEVGLGYLRLDRAANSLSGGEAQRVRLAAQLGSNLRGVLYVLDEPTIGLHPRDNAALLATLGSLRDKGNSLVVVEHDEETIAAADHLIDLGPGAGSLGGSVVYQGPPPTPETAATSQKKKATKKHTRTASASTRKPAPPAASPTFHALTHPMSHPSRGAWRPVPARHPFLRVEGCRANNLRDIDAAIPLARLTVITGVSGSGKSTLLHHAVAPAARKTRKKPPASEPKPPFRSASGFQELKGCYEVDQSPIGKTSRSCPATYVKVFDLIRTLFAKLPEARARGFDASRFSFNADKGRCAECKGNGRVKLEMDFLPPTWVHCTACDGRRYNPATMELRYRGMSVADVLEMTIADAAEFFAPHPRIADPLRLMADTGLGYLRLGQPSPTLSGGEAQRIKLVSELIKGRGMRQRLAIGNTPRGNLYLIEEPTVGLHHEDIRRLVDILHRLVDEGHTVVVVEHHMDVAAEADWIIDLGPEPGEGGGTIVAQGPPTLVSKTKSSRTAPYLRKALGSP